MVVFVPNGINRMNGIVNGIRKKQLACFALAPAQEGIPCSCRLCFGKRVLAVRGQILRRREVGHRVGGIGIIRQRAVFGRDKRDFIEHERAVDVGRLERKSGDHFLDVRKIKGIRGYIGRGYADRVGVAVFRGIYR